MLRQSLTFDATTKPPPAFPFLKSQCQTAPSTDDFHV